MGHASRATAIEDEAPTPPEAVTWEGRVAEATGRDDVAVGATCAVRVVEVVGAASASNCRVRVDCGEDEARTIYGAGASGYNRCGDLELGGEAIRDVSDTDGDPRLDVDLSGGRVVVADDHIGWRVVVLDERGREEAARQAAAQAEAEAHRELEEQIEREAQAAADARLRAEREQRAAERREACSRRTRETAGLERGLATALSRTDWTRRSG